MIANFHLTCGCIPPRGFDNAKAIHSSFMQPTVVSMNQLIQTTTFLVGILVLVGCKSAPKEASDMDAILKTVVYDTSVPVIPASFPVGACDNDTQTEGHHR